MLQVKAQRYEIGGTGSATGYMGDINNSNPFYFRNFGGGFFLKYNLDPTWGIKLSANQLLIYGADKDFINNYQQERNLTFRNKIKELSILGEFNFWTYFNSKYKSKFTPYISAGFAMIKHDPYIYYNNQKVKLRPLKLEYDESADAEVYNNWAVAIPFGIGVKYKLNSSWTIGIEANYRLAFTDYIDNVSKYYATSVPSNIMLPNITVGESSLKRPFDISDWSQLADPSNKLLMKAGTLRGDGSNKDGYMTTAITLTYTIFDQNCYSWINR